MVNLRITDPADKGDNLVRHYNPDPERMLAALRRVLALPLPARPTAQDADQSLHKSTANPQDQYKAA